MIDIKKLIEDSKKLTLLYIEDDADAREMTSLMLEDFFETIIVAKDGEDGLKKFQTNDIDIIITDINMPKMNGLDMSEKIRHLDENIPILVFSAHNESDFFIKAIKIGIDGYLLKPINLNDFSKSLNKTIKNIQIKKENENYKRYLEEQIEVKVEELREKDKILIQQSKMASMGEMMDIIAHQWKQPLNAIIMQKELIKLDLDNNTLDAKTIEKSLETTETQVQHLLHTINEFRDFFRPNVNITHLNLKNLLNSIKILLKDELTKNLVQLDIDCNDNIKIKANSNDIKHLFISLISNAKDEMIKSNIQDRLITIRCEQQEEDVIIYVKDNGNGIPFAIVEDIFKPHFTTKSKDGGTGIGLYMCKQIVQRYYGDITLSSNHNGAEFKVVLH